jgi:hypothetical protein
MAPQVLIKVLAVTEDVGKNVPVIDAYVTFIPKSLIGSEPGDSLISSGYAPYWKEEWQTPTYSHKTDGHYLPDPDKIKDAGLSDPSNPTLEPQPGEWLLVVSNNLKSPVVQRITLETKKGVLRALPGWASVDGSRTGRDDVCAATVSINNYADGSVAENTLITVLLFPAANYCFMAGHDSGGTRFVLFAENRMKLLYKEKTLNDGARVAFLDCQSGARYLVVKGKVGWLTVARKSLMAKEAPPEGETDQRMGILDYYFYLNHIGARAPKTMIETGILSHAYVYGPVLWNTYDETGTDVNRDPADLDGRSKDWQNPGTMASYPDIKDAFHADGFFKLWGCHADHFYTAKLNNANKKASEGKSRDEFYVFDNGEISENLTLDFMKLRTYNLSKEPLLKRKEYCCAASAFLDIPCWGTPMGMGANYIEGKMVAVGTEPFYTYVKREFELDLAECRDTTFHFDYSYLNKSTMVMPAWNRLRWSINKISVDRTDTTIKSFPAFTIGGKMSVLKEVNYSFASRSMAVVAADGLRNAGVAGHLYIFKKMRPRVFRYYLAANILCVIPDNLIDTAVLCEETRKYHLYTKNVSETDWTLYDADLPAYIQKRVNKKWEDDTTTLTYISGGLLMTGTDEAW